MQIPFHPRVWSRLPLKAEIGLIFKGAVMLFLCFVVSERVCPACSRMTRCRRRMMCAGQAGRTVGQMQHVVRGRQRRPQREEADDSSRETGGKEGGKAS